MGTAADLFRLRALAALLLLILVSRELSRPDPRELEARRYELTPCLSADNEPDPVPAGAAGPPARVKTYPILPQPAEKPGICAPWLETLLRADAILDPPQRMWIAGTIAAVVAQPKPANVIIWGLGKDSDIWFRAWCGAAPGSELVLVEHDDAWMKRTAEALPHLMPHAIHFANYSSTVADLETFLARPTHAHLAAALPKRITSRCFDVHLLDAPPGAMPQHFGRHELAAWTAHHAKECIGRGHPRDIIVFMHDITRIGERRAINDLLIGTGGEPQGELGGSGGRLGAVIFRARRTGN
ncbi:hypothetical protein DFJ74DRAFT_702403 [Hyaloraphidium curvatum]|nr:hypothetical protein DFJ74DRAFT_702403 [Hyaloraphidium curvatum]